MYTPGGIYKTIDRGVTWNLTTASISAPCNPINGYILGFTSVQVDPSQPLTVYMAAGPNLGCSAAQNGLYKSPDGGANWNLLLNASAMQSEASVGARTARLHVLFTKGAR